MTLVQRASTQLCCRHRETVHPRGAALATLLPRVQSSTQFLCSNLVTLIFCKSLLFKCIMLIVVRTVHAVSSPRPPRPSPFPRRLLYLKPNIFGLHWAYTYRRVPGPTCKNICIFVQNCHFIIINRNGVPARNEYNCRRGVNVWPISRSLCWLWYGQSRSPANRCARLTTSRDDCTTV
jgi:hypothetical protein